MGNLANKVALITGGARGQGRAHAVALAKQGADVVLVDAPGPVASVGYGLGTESDLSDTVKLVQEQGRTALAIQGDVRNSADLRHAVTKTLEAFGHLDILLANAGIVTYGQLSEMDDQQWQDMIDINLTGVANSIRAVLPHMLERSYGRIVVTASQSSRRGMPNLSHYCAAKWGLIGLVKTVALEVAPSLGITCNAVLPGGVDTPMMRHDEVYRVFAPELDSPRVEDLEERLRRFNPMPTAWIEPSDISHGVLYLVSEEARYVSGATLDIAAAFNAS
ncbi:mycofactocin-coupled SDR family oxidoreductase [Amycolatopsis sp. GM8]|uniref:mycofactocin-coupled SDR family oxidoreductase n=1 Tax=Amycolatopsis sp. GM8 TaxID=2896530 RepID=UPI001F370A26|nr:mycofactocin-coupled SDR family oxidoreductase [Amycolatopsis sp. GM8]